MYNDAWLSERSQFVLHTTLKMSRLETCKLRSLHFLLSLRMKMCPCKARFLHLTKILAIQDGRSRFNWSKIMKLWQDGKEFLYNCTLLIFTIFYDKLRGNLSLSGNQTPSNDWVGFRVKMWSSTMGGLNQTPSCVNLPCIGKESCSNGIW